MPLLTNNKKKKYISKISGVQVGPKIWEKRVAMVMGEKMVRMAEGRMLIGGVVIVEKGW